MNFQKCFFFCLFWKYILKFQTNSPLAGYSSKRGKKVSVGIIMTIRVFKSIPKMSEICTHSYFSVINCHIRRQQQTSYNQDFVTVSCQMKSLGDGTQPTDTAYLSFRIDEVCADISTSAPAALVLPHENRRGAMRYARICTPDLERTTSCN